MKIPAFHTPVSLNHIWLAEFHLRQGSESDHDETELVYPTLLLESFQMEFARKHFSASPTHHSSI